MAGDWIKWTIGFARKPEILAVAEELGISRQEAAGIVMELFEWLDANTTDGHVRGVTPVTLSALLGRDNIVDTLSRCGWIKMREDGTWHLVNWDRHNGKSAKSRALSAQRQASSRAARHAAVTDLSRCERDTSATREEKRREEKNTEQPPIPPNPAARPAAAAAPQARQSGRDVVQMQPIFGERPAARGRVPTADVPPEDWAEWCEAWTEHGKGFATDQEKAYAYRQYQAALSAGATREELLQIQWSRELHGRERKFYPRADRWLEHGAWKYQVEPPAEEPEDDGEDRPF